jgi:hypothetical protein
MNGDELETMKGQIAITLTHGVSMKPLARAQNVPESSVYRWASDAHAREFLFGPDTMSGVEREFDGNWA